jgi:hypothetical protein
MGYNSSDAEKKVLNAGEYEAVIINADARTTTTGKQYLNICLTISSENENVYTKIFRDAASPNEFNKKRVGALLKALKIKRDIADDFDLIQTIKNKKCIVNLTKEYNDYSGTEENNVKFFKESSLQEEDKSQPAQAQPQPTVVINDDDLPF